MSVSQVVTIGETLATFSSTSSGPVMRGHGFSVSTAGSESNVAIGLSRLGIPALWIGSVGDDGLGDMVLRELRAEGVRIDAVRPPGTATAVIVKERLTEDRWRISYNRRGSAGSMLDPDRITPASLEGARVLHVSGISLGLGAIPAQAVQRAIELAREAGIAVSFDVNYRSALWSTADAAAAILPLLRDVDILFASNSEAEMLVGEQDAAGLLDALTAAGPREVIITRGADGAVARQGDETLEQRARCVRVIDPVGAGDAFVAGYLAARLRGHGLGPRLALGADMGAYAVSTVGDWEGLPTDRILRDLDHPGDVHR